jgi:hypothetical protein
MTSTSRVRRALAGAIVAALLAPAWLAAQPVHPLRFQAGSNSASANGQLKGPNEPARDYVVALTAGQMLNVSLDTQSPGTYFSVLGPYGDTLYTNQGDQRTSWSGRAVDGGNYRVRVFLDDASSRAAKGATYTVKVSADRP